MTLREQLQQLSKSFDDSAHYLQPAVDRGIGGMTLEDYKERVMLGDMQLWCNEGFAAVTEVINYPQSRVVVIHLAGGALEPLLGAAGELDQFARMVGATGIEIVGRKGWAKVLKEQGYQEIAVHLYREVPNGRQ